jgi:AraC-like DNA-binding protein
VPAGVAEQSGFSSQIRLATVFRQVTGTTPSAYRKSVQVHP